MAAQPLAIWAKNIVIDNQTNTPQRRVLTLEEWSDGLLRDTPFSAQQYNSLLNVLTSHSNPYPNTPYPMKDSITTPEYALEMNGQSFTQEQAPELYEIYTGILDDLSTALAGHKYIIRIQ